MSSNCSQNAEVFVKRAESSLLGGDVDVKGGEIVCESISQRRV